MSCTRKSVEDAMTSEGTTSRSLSVDCGKEVEREIRADAGNQTWSLRYRFGKTCNSLDQSRVRGGEPVLGASKSNYVAIALGNGKFALSIDVACDVNTNIPFHLDPNRVRSDR